MTGVIGRRDPKSFTERKFLRRVLPHTRHHNSLKDTTTIKDTMRIQWGYNRRSRGGFSRSSSNSHQLNTTIHQALGSKPRTLWSEVGLWPVCIPDGNYSHCWNPTVLANTYILISFVQSTSPQHLVVTEMRFWGNLVPPDYHCICFCIFICSVAVSELPDWGLLVAPGSH